jgi:glyoxylase-like metal-dependent hydrolase (beta-lactamase superfamily II)
MWQIAQVLLLGSCLLKAAFASSPQIKSQSPGFYRMMVGEFEVTALFDGFFPIKPKEVLKPQLTKKQQNLLSRLNQENLLPTSINGFLINTGSRLILVDTGCGAFFGPSFGRLLSNLKASGYSPEQVDEVAITHMHSDHLGGIVSEGKAVFPHAKIRVDQRDVDYWLNTNNSKVTQPPIQGMFDSAVTAVSPYQASKQFKPFQGKTELAPGVNAVPVYGHTPGHTIYTVMSQGKKLVLVGDIFHVESVQFSDPMIHVAFDSDSKQAVEQRKKFLNDAVKEGFLIGGAHLPFPGIGRVLLDKSAYRYFPVSYSPVIELNP